MRSLCTNHVCQEVPLCSCLPQALTAPLFVFFSVFSFKIHVDASFSQLLSFRMNVCLFMSTWIFSQLLPSMNSEIFFRINLSTYGQGSTFKRVKSRGKVSLGEWCHSKSVEIFCFGFNFHWHLTHWSALLINDLCLNLYLFLMEET